MQKIYLNKETHVVEQIIKEDYDNFENYNDDTFGNSFYMVIDENNDINDYDFVYNISTNKFDRVFEAKAYTPNVIEPNETQIQIDKLKKENKLLNKKIDRILAILEGGSL